MPCWEVNLMSVEFKVKNIVYLEQALKSLNLNYYIYKGKVKVRFLDGSLEIDLENQTMNVLNPENANRIKRAYSKVVIEEIAKKKKWALKNLGDNKLRLRRF